MLEVVPILRLIFQLRQLLMGIKTQEILQEIDIQKHLTGKLLLYITKVKLIIFQIIHCLHYLT